jgi:hypothetical protein
MPRCRRHCSPATSSWRRPGILLRGALRDIGGLHRWIERESPSVAAQQVGRHCLAEIGDEAWRSPSVPIDALSNQPEYEVREVALPVEGAWFGRARCESIRLLSSSAEVMTS